METTFRGKTFLLPIDNMLADGGMMPFTLVRDFTIIDPLAEDQSLLAKACMFAYVPEFYKKVTKGDILVVGKNFCIGLPHVHNPIAIKGCGVAAVLAESFENKLIPRFARYGLPLMAVPGITSVHHRDELEVDLRKATVSNLTSGKTYAAEPMPPYCVDWIQAGSFFEVLREKIQRTRPRS